MLLYFGSRAIAAVGNLLSVAVFARLVGPAEYGAYILMFAWTIVVYGFAAQWMKFAYFGVFRAANEDEIIATYLRLMLLAITLVTAGLIGVAWLLGWTNHFALALISLFVSMTIYEGVVEISRTRLQVKTVAVSMIGRAVVVLLLGCAALYVVPEAWMLALGVSVGHIVAALPSLYQLRHSRLGRATRAATIDFLRYGWPLIFSFGVFALGQSIDRFLISRDAGNEVLGPYGVVADMMRQSYMVVGESIALALITVAKRMADEGNREHSNKVMHAAFTACVSAAGFGAVFFVLFGPPLLELLLGASFVAPIHGIIPIFAVAFGFMMLRSFYFAQVIYFTDGSYLELLIAIVFVSTSAILALVLVPRFGAVGGATALMIAQGAGCGIAAFVGRKIYHLPFDLRTLLGIGVISGLMLVLASAAAELMTSRSALIATQLVIFAGGLAVAVWRYDLLRLLSGTEQREGYAR